MSTSGTHLQASPSAWYALAVLAVVTFFALLDRQILLLLAEPIRIDLKLSDLQLGMIQGFGVALFAALAGFPLGWATDRFDRRAVLALCIAAWSLAVIGCALSDSFLQLLISSAMVGAGEAGLAPVMYALIPLFFFGRQRQIANSIAAMASVGGGALAFTVAGQIVSVSVGAGSALPPPFAGLDDWRISLIAAAALAPAMILLVFTIRVPRTQAIAAQAVDETGAALLGAKAYFLRHRSTYLRFYTGGAMGGFAFAALSVWITVVAARRFSQTPSEIGSALGAAQIISAGTGFLLSIAVARILGNRLGPVLPIRMFWIGSMVAATIMLSLLWVSTALHLYVVYASAGTFLTFAAMAFPTALQSISPSHLRGRAASIQFIAIMLASSSAPPLVGALSDWLAPDGGSVLLALTIIAAPALFGGALLIRSCEGLRLEKLLREVDANPVVAEPRSKPDVAMA
jgi:MFS family permease